MFAPQPEIRDYLERTAAEHDVLEHVQLDSRLTAADWDENAQLWRIEINEGERALTARYLVAGLGALSRRAYPELDGIEKFAGRAFHSADWDHDYDFTGKRVAVIGTGASAIQFVPKLAEQVAQLDLYQRTPPWIVPKADRRITRVERFLFRRVPALQKLYRQSIYWRLEARVIGFTKRPEGLKLAEQVARFHIRRQISDPELRRKVTPDYALGCKRILISNDYYPALARPNVDVHADGIARVTERGVVTPDGVEHEADVIVFGTGFRPNDLLTPLSIRGRHGIDINDAWRDGTVAHKGTTVAGFPNVFLLVGPNTGLAHSSMVHMIESQVQYVLAAMDTLRRRGIAVAEVREEAVERYNRALQAKLDDAVWSQGGCVSWYLDAHGNNRTLWPGFTFDFRRRSRGSTSTTTISTRPPFRRRRPPSEERAMAKKYDVNGRTAFITGAARGIGAETARRLHSKGANVALVGLEPDLLEALAAELGDRAEVFEADVTDSAALERAVAGAVGRFGGIDVAIANAGIQMAGSIRSAPLENLERVIEVNLLGVLRTDRAVIDQIIERKGYLLNIASLAAVAHAPLMGPYTASKAGTEALTDALRLETHPTGARVGCAYFGFIDTDIVRESFAIEPNKVMRSMMPRAMSTPIPVSKAVDAIEGGIEKRRARVWAPRMVGPALVTRGVFQPISDLITRRSKQLPEAIALADTMRVTDDPVLGSAVPATARDETPV